LNIVNGVHGMKRILIALAALWIVPVHAQTALVVPACGQAGYASGYNRPLTQDINGLQCHAIVGPGSAPAATSLDGALGTEQSYPQFADTFSAALDTTTNWTAKNSTGTAATSAGQLVINSSTTASAWGGVTSQQNFAPVGIGSQIFGVLASFTVTTQANSVRVFGVFTVPTTPTTAVPVTDGYIFRLDGTGALFAEIWSAGVAISSTNVTVSCLPQANFPAIFAIRYRASLVQFICGSSTVVFLPPVQGINPVQQILPLSALSIAGSTPPAASAVMNLSALAFGTTSPAAIKGPGQAPTVNDAAMVVSSPPYGSGVTPLTGNGAGSTGAVVGTLAAAAGKTNYLCDFDVSEAGTGAYTVTIAGLLGGSKVYQFVAPNSFTKPFTPCVPASAVNTAITLTTSANGTATAANVNSSGFQQ